MGATTSDMGVGSAAGNDLPQVNCGTRGHRFTWLTIATDQITAVAARSIGRRSGSGSPREREQFFSTRPRTCSSVTIK
jgi:hypothetical protein